ncbi:MAG TPA: SUMF1/EgtB/PvdO family nonheme iron enzyme [Terriglobia bacterium]|nr:SUMF1/EgtB/PvdO family nonheme iron enzyme [Terriglobia bacterium]
MGDIIPTTDAHATDRQKLLARLKSARARTDEIFQLVRPEALGDRPIPERHRIIFYLGHFEAFDWNLLGLQALGLKSFHPQFDGMFAFGIDPTEGELPSDEPSDWPSKQEIDDYNARARQAIDAGLERASLADPSQPLLQNGLAIQVGIEHRLMHAETLAYMLHQLPLERKFLQSAPPAPAAPAITPRMVQIQAGTATLGLPLAPGSDFGWDNEFEQHAVSVPEFSIDAHNVTNRQFIDFMLSGGYDNREFWDQSGWGWKTKRGIYHPTFWMRRHEAWYQRTMFAEISLPLDWPVYVSHAEASAYLRWRGKTLPTEAQFHRAAYGTPAGTERAFPWGDAPPDPHHGNFDFQRWDAAPVGAHPAGLSAFGVADLVGNGWEWTSTPFAPFSGFQPFPFYPGYSRNFFDGRHYVLKGGSPRTAACMLRRSFRNWFQPNYPYIYAKFRGVAQA